MSASAALRILGVAVLAGLVVWICSVTGMAFLVIAVFLSAPKSKVEKVALAKSFGVAIEAAAKEQATAGFGSASAQVGHTLVPVESAVQNAEQYLLRRELQEEVRNVRWEIGQGASSPLVALLVSNRYLNSVPDRPQEEVVLDSDISMAQQVMQELRARPGQGLIELRQALQNLSTTSNSPAKRQLLFEIAASLAAGLQDDRDTEVFRDMKRMMGLDPAQ